MRLPCLALASPSFSAALAPGLVFVAISSPYGETTVVEKTTIWTTLRAFRLMLRGVVGHDRPCVRVAMRRRSGFMPWSRMCSSTTATAWSAERAQLSAVRAAVDGLVVGVALHVDLVGQQGQHRRQGIYDRHAPGL